MNHPRAQQLCVKCTRGALRSKTCASHEEQLRALLFPLHTSSTFTSKSFPTSTIPLQSEISGCGVGSARFQDACASARQEDLPLLHLSLHPHSSSSPFTATYFTHCAAMRSLAGVPTHAHVTSTANISGSHSPSKSRKRHQPTVPSSAGQHLPSQHQERRLTVLTKTGKHSQQQQEALPINLPPVS
jgi:hypothetical protein